MSVLHAAAASESAKGEIKIPIRPEFFEKSELEDANGTPAYSVVVSIEYTILGSNGALVCARSHEYIPLQEGIHGNLVPVEEDPSDPVHYVFSRQKPIYSNLDTSTPGYNRTLFPCVDDSVSKASYELYLSVIGADSQGRVTLPSGKKCRIDVVGSGNFDEMHIVPLLPANGSPQLSAKSPRVDFVAANEFPFGAPDSLSLLSSFGEVESTIARSLYRTYALALNRYNPSALKQSFLTASNIFTHAPSASNGLSAIPSMDVDVGGEPRTPPPPSDLVLPSTASLQERQYPLHTRKWKFSHPYPVLPHSVGFFVGPIALRQQCEVRFHNHHGHTHAGSAGMGAGGSHTRNALQTSVASHAPAAEHLEHLERVPSFRSEDTVWTANSMNNHPLQAPSSLTAFSSLAANSLTSTAMLTPANSASASLPSQSAWKQGLTRQDTWQSTGSGHQQDDHSSVSTAATKRVKKTRKQRILERISGHGPCTCVASYVPANLDIPELESVHFVHLKRLLAFLANFLGVRYPYTVHRFVFLPPSVLPSLASTLSHTSLLPPLFSAPDSALGAPGNTLAFDLYSQGGLTFLPSTLLTSARVLDPSRNMLHALAAGFLHTWFGHIVTPKSEDATWVLLGLVGFVTRQFLAQLPTHTLQSSAQASQSVSSSANAAATTASNATTTLSLGDSLHTGGDTEASAGNDGATHSTGAASGGGGPTVSSAAASKTAVSGEFLHAAYPTSVEIEQERLTEMLAIFEQEYPSVGPLARDPNAPVAPAAATHPFREVYVRLKGTAVCQLLANTIGVKQFRRLLQAWLEKLMYMPYTRNTEGYLQGNRFQAHLVLATKYVDLAAKPSESEAATSESSSTTGGITSSSESLDSASATSTANSASASVSATKPEAGGVRSGLVQAKVSVKDLDSPSAFEFGTIVPPASPDASEEELLFRQFADQEIKRSVYRYKLVNIIESEHSTISQHSFFSLLRLAYLGKLAHKKSQPLTIPIFPKKQQPQGATEGDGSGSAPSAASVLDRKQVLALVSSRITVERLEEIVSNFRQNWITGTAVPQFHVAVHYNRNKNQLEVVVEQIQRPGTPLFQGPLKVQVVERSDVLLAELKMKGQHNRASETLVGSAVGGACGRDWKTFTQNPHLLTLQQQQQQLALLQPSEAARAPTPTSSASASANAAALLPPETYEYVVQVTGVRHSLVIPCKHRPAYLPPSATGHRHPVPYAGRGRRGRGGGARAAAASSSAGAADSLEADPIQYSDWQLDLVNESPVQRVTVDPNQEWLCRIHLHAPPVHHLSTLLHDPSTTSSLTALHALALSTSHLGLYMPGPIGPLPSRLNGFPLLPNSSTGGKLAARNPQLHADRRILARIDPVRDVASLGFTRYPSNPLYPLFLLLSVALGKHPLTVRPPPPTVRLDTGALHYPAAPTMREPTTAAERMESEAFTAQDIALIRGRMNGVSAYSTKSSATGTAAFGGVTSTVSSSSASSHRAHPAKSDASFCFVRPDGKRVWNDEMLQYMYFPNEVRLAAVHAIAAWAYAHMQPIQYSMHVWYGRNALLPSGHSGLAVLIGLYQYLYYSDRSFPIHRAPTYDQDSQTASTSSFFPPPQDSTPPPAPPLQPLSVYFQTWALLPPSELLHAASKGTPAPVTVESAFDLELRTTLLAAISSIVHPSAAMASAFASSALTASTLPHGTSTAASAAATASGGFLGAQDKGAVTPPATLVFLSKVAGAFDSSRLLPFLDDTPLLTALLRSVASAILSSKGASSIQEYRAAQRAMLATRFSETDASARLGADALKLQFKPGAISRARGEGTASSGGAVVASSASNNQSDLAASSTASRPIIKKAQKPQTWEAFLSPTLLQNPDVQHFIEAFTFLREQFSLEVLTSLLGVMPEQCPKYPLEAYPHPLLSTLPNRSTSLHSQAAAIAGMFQLPLSGNASQRYETAPPLHLSLPITPYRDAATSGKVLVTCLSALTLLQQSHTCPEVVTPFVQQVLGTLSSPLQPKSFQSLPFGRKSPHLYPIPVYAESFTSLGRLLSASAPPLSEKQPTNTWLALLAALFRSVSYLLTPVTAATPLLKGHFAHTPSASAPAANNASDITPGTIFSGDRAALGLTALMSMYFVNARTDGYHDFGTFPATASSASSVLPSSAAIASPNPAAYTPQATGGGDTLSSSGSMQNNDGSVMGILTNRFSDDSLLLRDCENYRNHLALEAAKIRFDRQEQAALDSNPTSPPVAPSPARASSIDTPTDAAASSAIPANKSEAKGGSTTSRANGTSSTKGQIVVQSAIPPTVLPSVFTWGYLEAALDIGVPDRSQRYMPLHVRRLFDAYRLAPSIYGFLSFLHRIPVTDLDATTGGLNFPNRDNRSSLVQSLAEIESVLFSLTYNSYNPTTGLQHPLLHSTACTLIHTVFGALPSPVFLASFIKRKQAWLEKSPDKVQESEATKSQGAIASSTGGNSMELDDASHSSSSATSAITTTTNGLSSLASSYVSTYLSLLEHCSEDSLFSPDSTRYLQSLRHQFLTPMALQSLLLAHTAARRQRIMFLRSQLAATHMRAMAPFALGKRLASLVSYNVTIEAAEDTEDTSDVYGEATPGPGEKATGTIPVGRESSRQTAIASRKRMAEFANWDDLDEGEFSPGAGDSAYGSTPKRRATASGTMAAAMGTDDGTAGNNITGGGRGRPAATAIDEKLASRMPDKGIAWAYAQKASSGAGRTASNLTPSSFLTSPLVPAPTDTTTTTATGYTPGSFVDVEATPTPAGTTPGAFGTLGSLGVQPGGVLGVVDLTPVPGTEVVTPAMASIANWFLSTGNATKGDALSDSPTGTSANATQTTTALDNAYSATDAPLSDLPAPSAIGAAQPTIEVDTFAPRAYSSDIIDITAAAAQPLPLTGIVDVDSASSTATHPAFHSQLQPQTQPHPNQLPNISIPAGDTYTPSPTEASGGFVTVKPVEAPAAAVAPSAPTMVGFSTSEPTPQQNMSHIAPPATDAYTISSTNTMPTSYVASGDISSTTPSIVSPSTAGRDPHTASSVPSTISGSAAAPRSTIKLSFVRKP